MTVDAAGASDFAGRARSALTDTALGSNFRRAMDGLMSKRAAQFADPDQWARLRERGTAARSNPLAKLPELRERLEANCTANGIRVHWAEIVEQGNAIVLDILQRHDA